MSFLYFCYGSNMFTKRMHINCSSARKNCIAVLRNFKLAFAGYAESWKGASATIIASPNDYVWGVVWEISEEEESKLDRQEMGYKPIRIIVENQENTEIVCKSYQKLPTLDGYTEPSLVYKTVMIFGAKEHDLPNSYIEHIKAFKDNGYNGNVTVPVNEEIKQFLSS